MGNKGGAQVETKKALSAMERVERLEQIQMQNQAVLSRVLGALQQVGNRVDAAREVVDILAELLGDAKVLTKDQIDERAKERRDKALQIQVEQQRGEVAKAVEQGRLVAVEAVDENSLIVAAEYNEKGEKLAPGVLYSMTSQFVPAIRDVLPGKKVFDKIEAPDGHTLEVLEIYKPQKAPPAQAVTPDEQSDLATESKPETAEPSVDEKAKDGQE